MPNLNSTELAGVAARIGRIVLFFRQLLGIHRVALMFVSSLLVSLIEFAGLALIFPFIKFVVDPTYHQRLIEQYLPAAIGTALAEHRTFVVAAGIAMVGLYLVKGFLHSILIRYQANVAADINRYSSHQLIDSALHARYQLFQEHGAVKIAGISYSNTTHASLLFQSMVAACNEIALFGFVFVGMFLLSPVASITVIAVLFVLATGVFLPLSRRVARIGRQTQLVDLARHRFVFAMASAIRDIKIMGLEASFVRRNRSIVDQQVDLSAEYASISAMQRVAVEVLMVCAVVLGCIWMVFSGRDLVQMAPLLAAGGLVAVRAAPALSRLAGAYNGFRYSLPFVEGLLTMRVDIASYPQPRNEDHVEFRGEFEARNLCFAYRGTRVLENVSLTIRRGEVVAVVGPSGSGKSTLLDLIAGLQPPSSGDFYLGGLSFKPFMSTDFSSKVGYVPQSITLLDGSIDFNVSLEVDPDTERLQRAIRASNLSEFVDSLPHGSRTILGEGGQGVSGGQRQRMGIARALYREPELLILDEVTSALDSETESMVMGELLRLRGRTTLLIVTHNLSIVESADRIYRLEDGRLSS